MNDRSGSKRVIKGSRLFGRRQVLKGSVAIAGATALTSALAPFGLAARPNSKVGGTLNLGVDEDMVGLDPTLVTSFSSFWPISAVYNTLVSLDVNLHSQPSLAQSWELVGDKTYLFHLRPGVVFQNGKPLHASDVVFTLKRVLNPKSSSPARSYISAIKQVDAPDDHTVRITVSHPYAPLLINLADYNLSIVSEAAVANNGGNLQRTMLGTGPFKFARYAEGNYLQLTRNPQYWHAGQPYLDGVFFRVIPQQQSLLAGLQNSSLGMAMLSSGPVIRQAQHDTAIQLDQTPSLFVRTLSFNVTKPPFNNPLVREAISLVINRQAIIKLAEFGFGMSTGVLPISMKDWALPPNQLPNYTPDLAKARALLKQAGAEGLSFSIVCSPTYEGGQAVAEVIVDQLAQIGIHARLDSVEWGNYINLWVKHDFEAMVELRSGPPDPDSYLYRMLYANAPANNFGFNSPIVDTLLTKGRETANFDERKVIYNDVQRLIAQMAPVIMLYTPYMTVGATKDVRDFVLPPTGLFSYLRQTWIS